METDSQELRFFRPREIWALLKESCTSPWPYEARRRLGYGARPLNWTVFLPGAHSQGRLLGTVALGPIKL